MKDRKMGIRIDARMLGHSGIGVVIDAIASRWIKDHPDVNFQILINPSNHHRPVWLDSHNVEIGLWNAPIYSVKEHFIRPPRSSFSIDATWCPHYNLSLQLGSNVLTTVHDVFHVDRSVQRRSLAQTAYANLMFRWVAVRSKAIHFVSDFTRREFERLVRQPKCPTAVIWNGIGQEWFEPVDVDRSDLDARTVIFVGNAFPHKNLVRLMRAVSCLRIETDVRLIIVGKIEGLKNLDTEALEVAKKYHDFVQLTGRLEFGELRRRIAKAEVLAFPSLYEGFGLPPLEALASNTKIVISDIAVHREIYSRFAHFCDPNSIESIANSLKAALQNDRLGNESDVAEFVHSMKWDRTARELFGFLSLGKR